MIDGLVTVSGASLASAYGWYLSVSESRWRTAQTAGLVTVDLDTAFHRFVEAETGTSLRRLPRDTRDLSPVSAQQIAAIAGLFEGDRGRFAGALAELLSTLLGSYGRMSEQAREQGWSDERIAEALDEIRADFDIGRRDDGSDTGAGRWLRDQVVQRPYAQAAKQWPGIEGVDLVYPYMQYAKGGPSSRENHAALDLFVWRTRWSGESVVIPPNGYGCLCGVEPVDWQMAERRGYQGEFPVGVAPLEAFLNMGGADDGFPKGEYV